MADTPEKKVKRKVTTLLRKYDVWYFFPGNNGFGKSGIPDIICIVAGQFIGIECKADRTKKPTRLQELCGQEIAKAGGEWFLVCDDESLGKVEEYIRLILTSTPR